MIRERSRLAPGTHLTRIRSNHTMHLEEALKLHREWLETGGARGERADLSGMNLSGQDLSGVNLAKAWLPGANLQDA